MRKTSKTNKTICKTCGKEFMTLKSHFCSPTCRNIDYSKQDSEKLQGIEGEDFIICKWCGMKVKRMYGSHLKIHHPGKTTADYKNEFPGAPLACKKDNKNVAKAFVKFAKSAKGRQFFSDRIKGEKNPNSKENTSLETRQSRSPFSIKYYTKLGFTEEEAKQKISTFAIDMCKDRLTETQLEYWVQRTDGNVELAKELLKYRQITFSLKKCIDRLGEEKGRKRWEERQIKWKKKIYSSDTCIAVGSSKISKELFEKIKQHNTRSEFFISNNGKCYAYDIEQNKKIIEFNGDFWHCNPKMFEPNFFHPVKKQTAQQIWDYDKEKENVAREHGYKYLTIWEKDYRENPQQVVEKCKHFLES